MNNAGINGRVNIMDQNLYNRFKMYDKISVDDKSGYNQALVGEVEHSQMSDYISLKKILKLYKMLFAEVFMTNQMVYMLLMNKTKMQ